MKTKLTNSISLAAAEIINGNVAAFPTETVYGLGASAFDERAVRKIFKAKGRPSDNPLIVHIWSKKQLAEVAREITPTARKLIARFFPGPLSIVVKKTSNIPLVVTGGLQTVCVRMPSLPLTRRFLRACGVPVAAPSANLSGKPSPTSWEHVLHDLNGRIPIILRGPNARHGLESTVIDCTRFPPMLLRPGAVPLEEIEEVVGRVVVPKKLRKALSPGMHYRHYSPDAKVVLVASSAETPKKAGGNWSFIGFSECRQARFSIQVKTKTEYSRFLYGFLRACDERGISKIYAQIPGNAGLGRALIDRLKRAASR